MGIILDKYINLRNLLESYIRNIVELLIKVDNSHLYAQTGHFRRYITNEYKKYCKLNLTPYQNVLDITTLEPDKLRLLRDTYLDLRDSTIVMTSIMVAKNISLRLEYDQATYQSIRVPYPAFNSYDQIDPITNTGRIGVAYRF